jgi:hypothetical protein
MKIKRLLAFIFLVFSFLLLIYILPKSPEFPKPPENSVQSKEPADTESPLRRAYFTNLNRVEVISHYQKEFNDGFNVYSPRLNYPPEESATIIRDQTRSTYLEEIAHPFRESIYINGFEPKSEKDTILIDSVRWNQKIIIRYVPSPVWVRVVVLLLSSLSGYFLVLEFINAKKRN